MPASDEWRALLIERSQSAGIALSNATIEQLEGYHGLLAKWNGKINLTALPLEPASPETLDRLFVEPLAAATHVPTGPIVWFDLGSGGGSPAIPLKIVRPDARLTMIEARARKATFLREVARTLSLREVFVRNARFEAVAGAYEASAQLVTVRAVKLDESLVWTARRLLCPGGRLFLFGRSRHVEIMDDLTHQETVRLIPNRPSLLAIYRRS